MMCKSKGGYKRGHYDVQMKRADGKGMALWCGNEGVDATGSNMMCKLNGQMGNGGYDDVQMKGG